MIRQEHFEIDGTEFVRTYSDKGLMVHGGFPEGDYPEAVDLATLNREYTETDIPIDGEGEEQTEDEQYAEAGKILLGVME